MDEHHKTNFLSGLFILLGIAAFTGLMVYLQGSRPDPKGREITIVFEHAMGVTENTVVTLGGKAVGRVEAVDLVQEKSGSEYQTHNEVRLRLDPSKLGEGIQIFDDAYGTLKENFFGGPIVILNPGTSGTPLPNDSRLRGVTPASLGDVLDKVNAKVDSVDGIIANISSITETLDTRLKGDNSPLDRLDEMADGASNLMDSAVKVADNANHAIETLQPALERIEPLMTSGEAFLVQLSEVTTKLDESIRALQPAIESAAPTVQETKRTIEELGKILRDNRDLINETLTNVRNLSESADEIMSNRMEEILDSIANMATSIAAASATIESVLEGSRSDLKLTMVNLRKTSNNLNQMVVKIRRDPSVILWGTDEDDNSADRERSSATKPGQDPAIRESGRLGPRDRE